MPELPEVRIMSNFINTKIDNKRIKSAYHVERGNNPKPLPFEPGNQMLTSLTNGKELVLNLGELKIFVFMGMNGNWKYVETENWNSTNHIRLRFDDETGHSLILHGGFMGPKYSVGKPFGGVKRGADPTKNFDKFKNDIFQNLEKKDFDKPTSEVLMNQKYFNGVGAYLNAEIIGRLDYNPFQKFNTLSKNQIDSLLDMIVNCCEESIQLGGGELISWHNPLQESKIDDWIKFYGKKDICQKYKFGTRNIWIQKKWIK
jgi:endonuclease VIII-like 1